MNSESSSGTGGEQQGAVELGLELALEEERGEADADFAEGRALALDRQGDLIDARGSVDGAQLTEEAAIAQLDERGTHGHDFIDRAGIGVDEGDAVAVGERGVIDLDVVADDGLQQRGDGRVVLENDGDEVAGLGGAGRLEAVGGHFGFQRLARGVQDLVGDELGVVVAGLMRWKKIWET